LFEISIQEINSLKSKKERSLYALYQKFYSGMKLVCMRYQKNDIDADDAINRSFLKLVDKIESYNQQKSFHSWFSTVIVNTNLDLLRKEKRNRDQHLYVETYFETSDDKIFEDDLEINFDQILHFIRTLSSTGQSVFNLYCIDGYSHKEIANKLSISEGNSKWHLSNARKKIQLQLKEFKLKQKQAV